MFTACRNPDHVAPGFDIAGDYRIGADLRADTEFNRAKDLRPRSYHSPIAQRRVALAPHSVDGLVPRG